MACFQTLKEQLNTLCPGMDVRLQEPMARHTSFRVGGPAALMALPASREEAVLCVKTAATLGIEPFFMGNGSNLLVPDEGVSRFIIKTGNLRLCRREDNRILADSGITLARLAVFARDEGLTGLEFAHGIPGRVGGAVYMNAGAYGGEMKDVVESVTYLDIKSGEIKTISGDECEFGYRHSIFSKIDAVIISARLKLASGDSAEIRKAMNELATRRNEKQPVDKPSAGSTFKRPEGYFAGTMIQDCGLKGYKIGGAEVSEKHAGFIINAGGATAKDVSDLIAYVQDTVEDKFSVRLEPEVRFVGEF